MDIKEIIQIFGLPEDASEEDVRTALKAGAQAIGDLAAERARAESSEDDAKSAKDDKEKLDVELENEKKAPPKHFEQVKAMFKRAAVGMDNRGYIAVRGDLTDEEKEIVEDANAKRRVRMGELAEQTGAKRADVEKMRAEKMVDHLSEGAWYQDAEGKWVQKK